jgi:hypothetical protein
VKHWGEIMQTVLRAQVPISQVSALFANSEISFRLSKGATFADLADSLDWLGDRHLGKPLAIYLRFNVIDHPVSALHSGI